MLFAAYDEFDRFLLSSDKDIFDLTLILKVLEKLDNFISENSSKQAQIFIHIQN